MGDAPRDDGSTRAGSDAETPRVESERARITDLLRAHRAGEAAAMDQLAPIVYDELREIAHRQLSRERVGHTLQTTGLVHEAFFKLVELDRIHLNDRAHFYALAARLMRQILIDYAKRRRAVKRGGGADPVPLSDATSASDRGVGDRSLEELIDLDDALTKLADVSARQARVVECRFFAGMNVEETAQALDVSVVTVKRDWKVARAWLHRELAGGPALGAE